MEAELERLNNHVMQTKQMVSTHAQYKASNVSAQV